MNQVPEAWREAVEALPMTRAVCDAGRWLQHMGAMDDGACQATLKFMLLAMNDEQRETLQIASDWRPMDSTPRPPKDGTPILAADFGRYGFIERAWWQPEFDAWITSCREIVMAPGYTIGGQARQLHSPNIVQPTWWMPLRLPTALRAARA